MAVSSQVLVGGTWKCSDMSLEVMEGISTGRTVKRAREIGEVAPGVIIRPRTLRPPLTVRSFATNLIQLRGM